jgi:penicillin-binding protein 1A
MDEPITPPPIGGGRAREQDYWTPKNYDGRSGGTLTLRRAIENSNGGIETQPEASLNRICDLAVEAQIYTECMRYYPFVLGAQPVRPIDLAAFYGTIANEGLRPSPYVVETIEHDGEVFYRHASKSPVMIRSVDGAVFISSKRCYKACFLGVRRDRSRALPPISRARPARPTTRMKSRAAERRLPSA